MTTPNTLQADLLESAKAVVAWWDKYFHDLPVGAWIEDAEFNEFLALRGAIKRVDEP